MYNRIVKTFPNMSKIIKKKKNTSKEVDEESDKKVVRRTLRLEARVTEQEYAQATELAKTCGLSMSDRTCQDLRLIHERLRTPHRLGTTPTTTVV